MYYTFQGTGGALQNKNSIHTSFLISEESFHFLIDCSGNPVYFISHIDISVSDLTGILLTHGHPDHIYAFPSIIHQMYLNHRTKPLYVFTNEYTKNRAESILNAFSIYKEKLGFQIKWYEDHNYIYSLNNSITLEMIPMKHKIPTSGFLFYRNGNPILAYSADTAPHDDFFQKVKKTKVVIHETASPDKYKTNEKAIKNGHTSPEALGIYAEKYNIRCLCPCHINDLCFSEKQKEIANAIKKHYSGEIKFPVTGKLYKI